MEHNARKIVFRFLGILFLTGIAIFAFTKYRPIIDGPQIKDISIHQYQQYNEHMITITGSVVHTAEITVNGRPLDIASDNTFITRHALSTGENILVFSLVDIFHKEKIYTYHIYNNAKKPKNPETYEQAQSLLEAQSAEDKQDPDEKLILINQKEE